MNAGFSLLTDVQARAADRVLEEEGAHRRHLVVYLSGAHAYGFPSPDSDLDLKAIHIERTDALLGLEPPTPTFDRTGFVDGVEIDYTSNEIGHALAGILKGNGNFLERVLGAAILVRAPELVSLAPIVQRALSRRVHRHYVGFAANQKKMLEQEPTAKKLLYVLRTSLTGTHLLRTGELVCDVTRLLEPYGFGEACSLVEKKREGENVALADLSPWRAAIDRAFRVLEEARASSPLPEDPPNVAELEAWLVALRRAP